MLIYCLSTKNAAKAATRSKGVGKLRQAEAEGQSEEESTGQHPNLWALFLRAALSLSGTVCFSILQANSRSLRMAHGTWYPLKTR